MKFALGLCLLGCLSAFAAKDGGTTGGGGNVEPSKQISEKLLIEAVQNSKKLVLAWINGAYYKYESIKGECHSEDYKKECSLYGKLFNNNTDALAVVEKTEIETKLNGPCLDANQQPHDGSAYSKGKDAICISISNLKKKLAKNEYQQQIAALVLHEITHLLGSDEDEAYLAQKMMLASLGEDLTTELFNKMVWDNLANAYGLIPMILRWELAAQESFDGQCVRVTKILNEMYELGNGFHIRGMNLFAHDAYDMYWNSYIKLSALGDYVCGHDQQMDESSRELSLFHYESKFGQRNRIKSAEYSDVLPSIDSEFVYLNRIVDESTLQSEMADVDTILSSSLKWLSKLQGSEFKTFTVLE